MIPTNKKISGICQCGVGSKRDAVNSESHKIWLNTFIQNQNTYCQSTEVCGPAEDNHVIVALKKKEKFIWLKWCPLTYRASGFLIMMHWTHLHSFCMPRPCTKWFFFPVQPQTLHADEIPPMWTVVTQFDLLFHNRLFWIPVISNSNPFTLVIWLYQLSWKCKLATVTSWTNLHGQIPKEEKLGQFTFAT